MRAYTLRWRIEEFHKAWKSGTCNVEDTQLRTKEAVSTWATMLAAVAIRAERLKQRSRSEPEMCVGDSGGPLFDQTTGKVVGVLSASQIIDGVQCLPASISYYVPTASFADFVAQALAEPEPL